MRLLLLFAPLCVRRWPTSRNARLSTGMQLDHAVFGDCGPVALVVHRNGPLDVIAPVRPQDLVEVLTPSGESCGTTELHALDACAAVNFGVEGTVFSTASALDPAPGPSGGGGETCFWHWWSGLLR